VNVRRELLHILEQAHSLAPILEAATRVVANRLDADRCSAFLIDEEGELARYAADTQDAARRDDDEMRRLASEVVAARHGIAQRGATVSLLASPLLLRDRMLGALVLLRSGHAEFAATDVETLTTACAQLVGIIENARIIDALDRGQRPTVRAPHGLTAAESTDGERILRGVGASPGIAIGAAVFRGAFVVGAAARAPAGPASAERQRVRTAIEKTRNDLLRIQIAAAREIDEEHALIFASHLLLLNDSMLLDRIDHEITSGMSAPVAVDDVLDEFETRLRLVPDPYLQEKTEDIADLRSRLLGHMLDTGDRALLGRRVVLSSSIRPSLVIELKAEGAQALVAEVGGATSHGVLLARAMGIPAVTGITDMLTAVSPADRLIVDGTTGVVVVRPSEDTVARYEREHRRAEQGRTEFAKFRDVLARTADGVRVELQANIGVASDILVARDNGAEGIGLYRTEFPFIVRDAFPTLEEQARIYRKAYELFPNGRINFRILDLGGDKFVAGSSIAMARSAFHGYRSIRVLFDHPDVLRDQVQALALAAGDRPLHILIPMVTSIEDLRRAKAIIAEALAAIDGRQAQRTPEIGAMIEVPAAVEIAGDIAKQVDFLSIGTNDLMQYALVVDREDARMAPLSDPYHPAILRMVARVIAAARNAGKTVGVCGEIAVRPDMALALMALGIDSLSVVPTAIPELKQALARLRLAPLQQAIADILALPDALSIAAALREVCAA
jgi:phosphotransferase system, enzyme I, PtsP